MPSNTRVLDRLTHLTRSFDAANREDPMPSAAVNIRNERRRHLAPLREIEALRRVHAQAIIAGGLFPDTSPYWQSVLYRLAEEHTAQERAALTATLVRLEEVHGDAMRLPERGAGRIAGDWASDAIVVIAGEWADRGFYLGLAVGMQLGSRVLDGGAR